MKIFGFDFSVSKPAMCFYDTDTKHMEFYCWPMHEDDKSIEKLKSAGININNRNLAPMSKKNFENNNIMVLEHTRRAAELSEMIANEIFKLIASTKLNDVYICSEGLSFGSKGNQTLDLSGYKYTLLTTLYKRGITHIYTYSPIAIKKIAKCSKTGEWGKDFMIQAIKETNPTMHKFIHTLVYNDIDLRKKSNYVNCVDDLVDSYWALRTFLEKETDIQLN